jgi:hypothetical protein
MSEFIRIERQRRLENFLHKIETTSPPPHHFRRLTKSLIGLYLGHLRAEDPEWPNSKITYTEVFQSFEDLYLHMYVHIPVQQRANAALKKLKEGNITEAEKMLKELASEAECKNISSEIQTIHRSKRGRNKKFNDLLDEIYKNNPSINTHELLKRVKKEIGKGVILRIDEQNNEIIIAGGGEFKITGLKDHLFNRRKKL